MCVKVIQAIATMNFNGGFFLQIYTEMNYQKQDLPHIVALELNISIKLQSQRNE